MESEFKEPIFYDDEHQDYNEEVKAISLQVASMNRKSSKSGAFQQMGLNPSLQKAIQHKGYKIPTPIQRRAIPVILEGRDVVGMARTGSGKTAAFVIPMVNKLKSHSVKMGARGLILSPNRELAIQTLKCVKEMTKYTEIRCISLIGGESMEADFSALASNPDVIVATPGRLMHLLIEMDLNLKSIEYVVFDEADRLFELGFADQLREILYKLSDSRQTLLFSATLPRNLIDFAKAGLSDPALIRLDAELKLSQDLVNHFFHVKKEDKEVMLIYTLKNLIKKGASTIIFVSTKYHVDYINALLISSNIKSTYIYGSLDQDARKNHLNLFRKGFVKVLVVTDVAARGIDIPLLDNVINFDFPALPKVYLHRVGRTARAGKTGTAFSFVSIDEIPYLLDLQIFSGKSLILANQIQHNYHKLMGEIIFGTVPPTLYIAESESIAQLNQYNTTVNTFLDSSKNAYKLFIKTRTVASKESYRRAKEILLIGIGQHPYFNDKISPNSTDTADLIAEISNFRPGETIFEIGKRGVKATESVLMQKRRMQLERSISKHQHILTESKQKFLPINADSSLLKEYKDPDFFMEYEQKDTHDERGYAINTFEEQANAVSIELTADDPDTIRKNIKSAQTWDKKKHKFVRNTVGADNKKMIKTESGQLITASYKTDRFKDWQKKRNVKIPRIGENELTGSTGLSTRPQFRHNKVTEPTPDSASHQRKLLKRKKDDNEDDNHRDKSSFSKKRPGSKDSRVKRQDGKKAKSELKNPGQILKARKTQEAKRARSTKTSKSFKPKPKKGSRR